MNVYLDHAATSYPKPECVYQAADRALRQAGSPGRTMGAPGRAAEEILEDARRSTAKFFGMANPQRVIFTLNCTDSLNMAIKGLTRPGATIVTDPYPHNAVARPLITAKACGARVRTCQVSEGFGLDLDDFERQCRDGVHLAVITHVSNVTGCVLPLEDISQIVHRYGGLLLLDAAQSAGAITLDMEAMGIDILAAPGHKGLLGPAGCGILLVNGDIPINPLREGGTGFVSDGPEMPRQMPYRLEAGTPPVGAVAGLAAGIDYLSRRETPVGVVEAELAGRLIDGLAEIPGINLFSRRESKTGVVSFSLKDREQVLVASLLDTAYGIAVRAGFHCAHRAHEAIGTMPFGTVRASFGWNNTEADAVALIEAVRDITNY